ncbi:hypothetical protein AAHB65_29225 [Bacillus toyonensis]
MELPTDYQRPVETSYRGETIHFHIDEGMHSRLVELGRKNGVSLFMVLTSRT